MKLATGELKKFVKRYTTLASAIDMLQRQCLTMLSPNSWPDRNDAYFLELYQQQLANQSVLALCCTLAPERSNHWDTFGPTMEGVCIEFKREALEAALDAAEATYGSVRYLSHTEAEALKRPKLEDLAFLKRKAFQNELEWRAIKLCPGAGVTTASVPIELDAINKIILSPRMPKAVKDSVKKAIRALPDCKKLKVERSTIHNSARWQKNGKRIADMFSQS